MIRTFVISAFLYLYLSMCTAEKVSTVPGAPQVEAQPAYNNCDHTTTTDKNRPYTGADQISGSADEAHNVVAGSVGHGDLQRVLEGGLTTTSSPTTSHAGDPGDIAVSGESRAIAPARSRFPPSGLGPRRPARPRRISIGLTTSRAVEDFQFPPLYLGY
ncbi:hypothetical protein FOZ60_004827 [Perkinsus olseni]|uniref:Uncharacterized protein n=1 Tax=Perkinsus olseni TaxID=32597 RepID=A0A7J6NSD5_PEROL|nr:hypothetical protein FOZ60_004827 [Perkinsus olseni]